MSSRKMRVGLANFLYKIGENIVESNAFVIEVEKARQPADVGGEKRRVLSQIHSLVLSISVLHGDFR